MAIYAIGDLQGCYDELQDLLDKINFDYYRDQLWLSGDLVNRGPKSLKCLQFAISHEKNVSVILGNHDLYLLAVAIFPEFRHTNDTLSEILCHKNCLMYLSWLRRRPFILQDEKTGFYMVHAGVYPQWSIAKALALANEVKTSLQGDNSRDFIYNMFGDSPDKWSDSLQGFDRFRFIINSFTRTRYLHETGRMNFSEKGPPSEKNRLDLVPWYRFSNRQTEPHKIIFGHWSTVTLGNENNFEDYRVYPIDTGCVWGRSLTALRLGDERLFSVPAKSNSI